MDKVTVSADALRSVLKAIMGPPHLIRELVVIHDLYQKLPMDQPDPITTLINEFNIAVETHNAAPACQAQP